MQPKWCEVLKAAQERGIQFAVGGAEDVLELFVIPEDRERMQAVLADCGVLGESLEWGYQAGGIQVAWAMPNGRASVDAAWVSRGSETELCGVMGRRAAVEELVWWKLYVMRRDRCEWPDVLRLFDSGESIDWDYLVGRLGDDAPLLAAALTIYGWLEPEKAAQIPVLVEILARPNAPMPDSIPRAALLG